MHTLTKRQLAEHVAAALDITQQEAASILETSLKIMADTLVAGGRIEFRDFGIFAPVERRARPALNPKTLERVAVPARRGIKFKAGKELIARVRTTATA